MTVRENPERETTVTTHMGAEWVEIYTCEPRYLSRLRKNAQAIPYRGGWFDGYEWAIFRVPKDRWDAVSGIKAIRNLSPEQKAELAERMMAIRQA